MPHIACVTERRIRRLLAIAVALLGALLFGCVTKQDVVVAKLRGRGTQRAYPVTIDQAWAISKTILLFEPTDRVDEHRSEGYMLTSDDSSTLTPSTYMGVFVEPDTPLSTKVTFVARRRTPTQSFAALTEGTFHRKFAKLVELITTVGPLPSQSTEARGGPDVGEEDAERRALRDAGVALARPRAAEPGADGGS